MHGVPCCRARSRLTASQSACDMLAINSIIELPGGVSANSGEDMGWLSIYAMVWV